MLLEQSPHWFPPVNVASKMPQCLASIKTQCFQFSYSTGPRGRGIQRRIKCIKTYGLSHSVQQTLVAPFPTHEVSGWGPWAEGHLGGDTASALWPRDFHQEVVVAPKMGGGGAGPQNQRAWAK